MNSDFIFSPDWLTKDLIAEAKAVGIPIGASAPIADKIIKNINIWVKKRGVILESDLYRKVAKEARVYSQDLAYVYHNRGRII